MVGEGICLLGRRTSHKPDKVDFFPLYDLSQKTFRHSSVGLLDRPACRLTCFTLYVIYAIYLNLSRRFAPADVTSLLCLLPIHLFAALYWLTPRSEPSEPS